MLMPLVWNLRVPVVMPLPHHNHPSVSQEQVAESALRQHWWMVVAQPQPTTPSIFQMTRYTVRFRPATPCSVSHPSNPSLIHS